MKRLRLIKPWKLRIQPQRLAHTAVEMAVLGGALPCSGPQSIDEAACRLRGSVDDRSPNARFGGTAAPRQPAGAPRSIFAPVTNERFRP